MKKLIVLFVLVISIGSISFSDLTVSGAPAPLSAKCAIMNFEKEYEFSKAVFVGEVLKVEKDGNAKNFEFRVEKFWKGIESKTVEVRVNERARYQAQFKVGGKYLVFAKGNEDDGTLWDGRCSRSKDLKGYGGAVEEDLKKLGEAKTCVDLAG